MIEGKTKRGFAYAIAEENVDQEFLDALAEAEDGQPLKVSKALRLLLGEEQREKLYDYLRNDKGKVPIDAVMEAFYDILSNDGTGAKKLLILAAMVHADEDALICDFAETYHIFDWRALPVRLAATLAAGLPETSRIRMKMAGAKMTASLLMQAAMVDRLSLLVWMQTKDGQKNRHRPQSVAEMLTGKEKRSTVQAFNSEEEFWAAIRAADEGK